MTYKRYSHYFYALVPNKSIEYICQLNASIYISNLLVQFRFSFCTTILYITNEYSSDKCV